MTLNSWCLASISGVLKLEAPPLFICCWSSTQGLMQSSQAAYQLTQPRNVFKGTKACYVFRLLSLLGCHLIDSPQQPGLGRWGNWGRRVNNLPRVVQLRWYYEQPFHETHLLLLPIRHGGLPESSCLLSLDSQLLLMGLQPYALFALLSGLQRHWLFTKAQHLRRNLQATRCCFTPSLRLPRREARTASNRDRMHLWFWRKVIRDKMVVQGCFNPVYLK